MKKRIFPVPNPTVNLFPDTKQSNHDSIAEYDSHIENTDLFKIFETVHDYIYANDGLSTQQAFEEILKIIFTKIGDESASEGKNKFFITDLELNPQRKESTVAFRERIVSIFERAKKRYSDLFDEKDKIKLSDSSLAFTIQSFQNYRFADSRKDIKGAAFQKFVSSNLRGERGQFFTPDPVVNFMVDFMQPNSKLTFLDPACGTGGFLYAVLRYIRHNEHRETKGKSVNNRIYKNINGIEINPSVAEVAMLRTLLEGGSEKNILCTNALNNFTQMSKVAKEFGMQETEFKKKYDLILTNPPFGSQGKVTDKNILASYQLGYKWKNTGEKWIKTNLLQSGQSPEILFIERCIELLNDGGRLGIVLPIGILANSSLEYVREFIKSHTKIIAVVELPPDTFIPHGTGVRASLLFVQALDEKTLKQEIDKDYPVFFGISNKIGYMGNKKGQVIYKKDDNGNIIKNCEGRPVIDEDLSQICNDFKKKGVIKKDNTFYINHSELDRRIDAQYYRGEYVELRRALIKRKAVPLKDIVQIVTTRSSQLSIPSKLIRYIELSDVNPLYNELISYKELYVHEAPSRASFEVQEGDIITAVSGNSTGTKNHASALVTTEFSGCICTNGFRVLKTTNKINPFYLLAFMRTDYFLKQMYQKRTGAAIPAVSDDDFREILVLLPSRENQDKIAKKIKESFELRAKSRLLFNEIEEFQYV